MYAKYSGVFELIFVCHKLLYTNVGKHLKSLKWSTWTGLYMKRKKRDQDKT